MTVVHKKETEMTINKLKKLLAEATLGPWTSIYQISGEEDVKLVNAAVAALPDLIAAVELLNEWLCDKDHMGQAHRQEFANDVRSVLARFK